jgi:hypothetical protein
MSSGIDNSGTGEASGKKSKPKKNKFGQISSHGPSVEQQSVSVPHENRQETISSQSSNRILPIRTDIDCNSHLDSLTHQKLVIPSCLLA